jgi:DNA modification methylase
MRDPLAITYRQINTLAPYARNSQTHSADQVSQIADSIKDFGFTNPVLIDEGGQIIAGHGRVLAANKLQLEEVPCIVLSGLSEEQRRAYVIADNKLALNAGWNLELLSLELTELNDADIDLSKLGFSDAELSDLLDLPRGAKSDPNENAVPKLEKVPISRTGDVWLLGKHRVMCGDSTSEADVASLMAGARAQLMHADPPYGMGKEADGVVNDNLYGSKLDEFQMRWWKAFRPHLDANASAYIWGNAPDLWRLWFAGGLAASEPLALRNEIVWDKKSIAGMASPDLTQYPIASERCLFFQFGRHIFLVNQTKDDYWPGWDPIRLYLATEKENAGFTASKVREICGNHMHGHWFGTSQWVFISRDNYEKLQSAAGGAAFLRQYDELQAEYRHLHAIFTGAVRDPARRDFDAARPFFDNAHDIMRDVWEFPRVVGEARFGHATPKPVAMMERIMRSSMRDGDVCIEPFGGSGSTLIGCEKTGRVCYTMEVDSLYVDVIVRRWQQFTGKNATLETSGALFDDVAAERIKVAA